MVVGRRLEEKQVGRVVEEELGSRKAEFILSEKLSAYRSRTYIHVRKTLRIVGVSQYHGISLQKVLKGESRGGESKSSGACESWSSASSIRDQGR